MSVSIPFAHSWLAVGRVVPFITMFWMKETVDMDGCHLGGADAPLQHIPLSSMHRTYC